MATLTINGDVYVNDDTVTTNRFADITLTSVGVDKREKLYPQGVTGMADLLTVIEFTIERFARKALIDKGVVDKSAKFVLRGPRRTQSGFIDAAVNDGAELGNFTWTEVDRRDGSTYTQSVSGYWRVVDPNVRGLRESLRLVVFPVNRLLFQGSTTYLSDADYT